MEDFLQKLKSEGELGIGIQHDQKTHKRTFRKAEKRANRRLMIIINFEKYV
jgi:hypothetical protein